MSSGTTLSGGKSEQDTKDPIVTYEVREDRVAVVTIDDKAETLNTIGPRFGEELTQTLSKLAEDGEVVAIVGRYVRQQDGIDFRTRSGGKLFFSRISLAHSMGACVR